MWKSCTLKIKDIIEEYKGWPQWMERDLASGLEVSILLRCLISLNWMRDSTQSL